MLALPIDCAEAQLGGEGAARIRIRPLRAVTQTRVIQNQQPPKHKHWRAFREAWQHTRRSQHHLKRHEQAYRFRHMPYPQNTSPLKPLSSRAKPRDLLFVALHKCGRKRSCVGFAIIVFPLFLRGGMRGGYRGGPRARIRDTRNAASCSSRNAMTGAAFGKVSIMQAVHTACVAAGELCSLCAITR